MSYDLKKFCKELRDIDKKININIETGDLLSFADFFFDGFFVDWMMQDRIHKAKYQLDAAIRKAKLILDDVKRIA